MTRGKAQRVAEETENKTNKINKYIKRNNTGSFFDACAFHQTILYTDSAVNLKTERHFYKYAT